MSIWDRFDDIANADEVKEAQSRFKPPEAGVYEVELDEISPAENKDGLPMLKGRFKKTDGSGYIFYNQNLQNINYPDITATNIAQAVELVSKLSGEEFEFAGLSDLANRVEALETGGIYNIRVSYGNKDTEQRFPRITCLGVAEETPF